MEVKRVTAAASVTVTPSETGTIKLQFAEASTGRFAERSDTVDREVGVAVQAFAVRASEWQIEQKGTEVVVRIPANVTAHSGRS